VSRFSTTQFPDADGTLILEVTQRRLEGQHSSIDAIDAKSGVAIAVSAGIVSALYAVAASAPDHVHVVAFVLIGLTTAAALFQGYRSVSAILPRDWAVGLDPDEILEVYRDPGVSERERTWIVAEGYAKAYNQNESELDAKASSATTGLYVLVVETVLLLTSLVALTYRA
jgi:hypothetical protein